jgi:hypothetical protein
MLCNLYTFVNTIFSVYLRSHLKNLGRSFSECVYSHLILGQYHTAALPLAGTWLNVEFPSPSGPNELCLWSKAGSLSHIVDNMRNLREQMYDHLEILALLMPTVL